MLADIFLCSITIFFAKAFTAGFVALSCASSLSLISFWSDCAAIARNFLSSSVAAFALFGISIAALPSRTQHITIFVFIDSLQSARLVDSGADATQSVSLSDASQVACVNREFRPIKIAAHHHLRLHRFAPERAPCRFWR